MVATSMDSVTDFIEVLCQCRLLEPEQQQELKRDLRPRYRDVHDLAKELIQRGWLTPYQVNQVSQGRGGDLTLGSYMLLERLGEGGMGQVFKARHRRLGRVVALKQIRKERMTNPTMVVRFHQEIQAAAKLSHPNIVLAYDADTADGVYFYTMEYVEGTTLSRLVKSSGPLLVTLACEYMRQTALGLQHAHERGLVHRDINPSNLIVTWTSLPPDPVAATGKEERTRAQWGSNSPLIKILDMGLARLLHPGDDLGGPASITKIGMIMGTPDFIAPEQALDARRADIRSDLYSLGCTFYYLLTGQVPFPGGTKLEKMFRHQSEEPRPLEQLRTEVPPRVRALVRKMMAKRPEDRFATPADVGNALMAVLGQE
jgi:serine/threonine-protein kinase